MIQAENQVTKITTLQNELHAAEKDLADAVGDVDQLERLVSEVRENLLLKDTASWIKQRQSARVFLLTARYTRTSVRLWLRVRFQYHEELSKQLDASKSECDAMKAKCKQQQMWENIGLFRYSLLKLHHLHVIVTELKHQLINEELAVTNYKISNLKKDNTKLA